jgi:predicted nucleotidyltransferase component of viral defense system
MNQKLNFKYVDQVKTLIDLLPHISENKKFAIKGGTAINLFVFDMPRLSVDIDLCYLPLTPRDEALSEIREFVYNLSQKIQRMGLETREKKTLEGHESTLFIQSGRVEVKVEINLVVRGSVYEPELRQLAPSAIQMFNRNSEMLCLHEDDLFGGKLCAALDRQHPRDFFDLYMFFEKSVYTRKLHQAFIVYLLSSKRPISDLIKPNFLDLKRTYEKQFDGMTSHDITLETLEETRKKVFSVTSSFFNETEKEFLLSFKRGEPNWDLFPIKTIQQFPSVKWKLYNIQSMTKEKRLQSLKKLEEKLY